MRFSRSEAGYTRADLKEIVEISKVLKIYNLNEKVKEYHQKQCTDHLGGTNIVIVEKSLWLQVKQMAKFGTTQEKMEEAD